MVFDSPNYLAEAAQSKLWVTAGALLVLANSVTVVAIGVVLYPILARHEKGIARAYLSARVLESVLLAVGLFSLLSIVSISEEYGKTTASSAALLEAQALLARAASFRAYQLAMILLGLGSLGFCYLFYQQRLVPRFIAGFGLAGYALLAVGAVLELLGYPVGVLLSVPGGLFEITLGGCLISRGLNLPTGEGVLFASR